MTPTFSIITPSYRQFDWLRLCAASIADQESVSVEHIVQDAGTGEGLEQWAATQQKLKLHVEKDKGMYDAINRGLARAQAELCAYLNCDEQYLPGALARIEAGFRKHPRADVLIAGSLVVDGSGQYICSRPAMRPLLRDLKADRMYNLTSSIFFRARVFRERKIFFDPQSRVIGDLKWLRQVVESGAQVETTDVFTSVFSDLGTNLALSEAATAEAEAKGPVRRLEAKIIVTSHRLRRLWAGHYHLPPLDYSIYTKDYEERRQSFHVEKPTGVWRNRL